MKFLRNKPSVAAAALALLTLATLGGWTQAANWAQWRGPERDGDREEGDRARREEGPEEQGEGDLRHRVGG